MSWLKIDDLFEEHAKVEPLSDPAHRLWFRCACWCKKAANEHMNGFIPLRKVVDFCGGAKPRALRLAKELVDAKGDPIRGHEHGLWETREGGWQFHDWAVYQPSKGSPPPPPESADGRSAAARAAGLASAEARRAKNGTAQPKPRTDSERRSTERPPNDTRTHSNPNRPNGSEPNAEPPDPDPVPRSGSNKPPPKDLTGTGSKAADSGVVEDETAGLQRRYELWARNIGVFVLEDGHKRPEFLAVWFAWCRPFGITEGPVITQRVDTDVMAIVNAFASGKTLAQLLAVGEAAEKSSFIAGLREQRRGGPSVFSAKMIRQLLADTGPVEPDIDPAIEAKTQQRLAHEAERQQREIDALTAEARAALIARGVNPDERKPLNIAALTADLTARIG